MYVECIVSLVMQIASGSALEMLNRVLVLFCTWPMICFAGHVLVFVLCEHFCLDSMCSHVYCLNPAHLVTSLLVQLPHLLTLFTLLICSLFILLVFVVLCQFVGHMFSGCVLSLPCLFLPNCQLSFPPTG